jgi:hypothetical protein
MIAFIDDHRDAYGVEPICKVLPIAPSTYHAHVARRIDASKRSVRARRDAALKTEVSRVFAENFGVYGARKVWRQLRREGFAVARCTVERLMASLGLRGVIRGKPVRTTISDKAAPCPLDHVNRVFHAPRPNALGSRTPPTCNMDRLHLRRLRDRPRVLSVRHASGRCDGRRHRIGEPVSIREFVPRDVSCQLSLGRTDGEDQSSSRDHSDNCTMEMAVQMLRIPPVKRCPPGGRNATLLAQTPTGHWPLVL